MHQNPKLERVSCRKQLLLFMMFGSLFGCAAAEPEQKQRLSVSEASTRLLPKPAPSYQQRDRMFATFERADQETVRLQPTEFAELPTAVVQALERRGCTIPQPWTAKTPANVVRGEFTTPGQVDLAVLCSRERISSIMVFRKGSVEDVSEIDPAADNIYLQGVGDGQIGYSRALSVASPAHIRRHNSGDSSLPHPQDPLNHDGIENHLLEKASTIWYWRAGEWLELPGAD